MLRKFVAFNITIATAIDKLWPAEMRVEGSQDYRRRLLPQFLVENSRIWDLGSGRYPQIGIATKQALGLNVVGLDIGDEELALAPLGAYDEAIAADLTKFRGRGDADQVISHCCFEHIKDNTASFQALASILKPGGRAAIYQPSGNAAFSRLNLILPENIKRKLLSLLPHNGGHGGWPAVYDQCTPRGFQNLARSSGLEVERIQVYWISSYFMAFAPLHFLWRIWQFIYRLFAKDEAAESFFIIVRKPK